MIAIHGGEGGARFCHRIRQGAATIVFGEITLGRIGKLKGGDGAITIKIHRGAGILEPWRATFFTGWRRWSILGPHAFALAFTLAIRTAGAALATGTSRSALAAAALTRGVDFLGFALAPVVELEWIGAVAVDAVGDRALVAIHAVAEFVAV